MFLLNPKIVYHGVMVVDVFMVGKFFFVTVSGVSLTVGLYHNNLKK